MQAEDTVMTGEEMSEEIQRKTKKWSICNPEFIECVAGIIANKQAKVTCSICFKAGIKELGARFKQVREESYDEQTFLNDLDELIALAGAGKILPPIVVKRIKTIYENPKYKAKTFYEE